MVKRDVNQVLRENFEAILKVFQQTPERFAEDCPYVSGTKKGKLVSERRLRYLLKDDTSSASLDIVAAIAAKADLSPWHLLVPGLDPKNHPVVRQHPDEKDLYERLKKVEKALEIKGKQ